MANKHFTKIEKSNRRDFLKKTGKASLKVTIKFIIRIHQMRPIQKEKFLQKQLICMDIL